MSASTIGPFMEVGPSDHPDDVPAGFPELYGDETRCGMGEQCCGWNGRYAAPIGEHLAGGPGDATGPDEIVAWSSPWYHPLAPDRPVCEDCADWITDDDAEHGNPGACELCMVAGPPHEHAQLDERGRPIPLLIEP